MSAPFTHAYEPPPLDHLVVPAAPLASSDRDEVLLEKLLVPHIARVYARALREWPSPSPELVHHLRVATRRLDEALAIVEPLVEVTALRRAKKRAKKLRRALGRVRTADVAIAHFHTDRDTLAHAKGPSAAVLAKVERRRAKAKRELLARFPAEKLITHERDLLDLAHRPAVSLSLAELAAVHLAHRARRLERATSAILRPHAVRAHHRLRIRVKQARYAAEIFQEAFPTELGTETIIAPLRAAQDALGALSDAEDLVELVHGSDPKRSAETEILAERLAGLATVRYSEAKRLLLEHSSAISARMRAAASVIHAGLPREDQLVVPS